MPGIYPRIIEIHRAKTVAPAIGLTGYSGVESSTDPANAQGEVVLFTGIPASIQAAQTGRKKGSALPQDAVFAPMWKIWVPANSLAKGTVRDRDVVVDDEGYRYAVAQAYWNLLGYQLVCIRQEA
jgi:hypothetical protein